MTVPIRMVRDDDDDGPITEQELDVIARENPQAILPTAKSLAELQTRRAHDRVNEDTTRYPGFDRIPTVDALVGRFAPGDLLMLGGYPGNGKSMLAQNLADDLTEQGVRTLYIGLEQEPHELRTKHACLRLGVHPRKILKPDKVFTLTGEYAALREAVHVELDRLGRSPDRENLIFCPTRRVNRVELAKWTTGAVRKYAVRCVIVDHVDHMDHGDGQNSVSELTETVHLAKELAKRHGIPIVMFSQLKRPGDPLQLYAPPQAQDFAGASAKERTADVMLGIWRPLKLGMESKELRKLMREARSGGKPGDAVFQPNLMGIRVCKDRLGDAPGKQTMVDVVRGRLVDKPIREGGRFNV